MQKYELNRLLVSDFVKKAQQTLGVFSYNAISIFFVKYPNVAFTQN
ncbi:MAG: hypothetical protein WEA59_01490 [Ferruginibacter sp.]